MKTPTASIYDTLLANFSGELDMQLIAETDQQVLSVLDNLQRILSCRAGTLSHLPDYGLPDMSSILQGLPATAQDLVGTMTHRLLKYENRLESLTIRLLPQIQPGHLEYALDVQIEGGAQATFGTTLGPQGRALVRHLKRRRYLARP